MNLNKQELIRRCSSRVNSYSVQRIKLIKGENLNVQKLDIDLEKLEFSILYPYKDNRPARLSDNCKKPEKYSYVECNAPFLELQKIEIISI